MNKLEYKPRRDFLKVISVSVVAMSAFPFIKFKKSEQHPEYHVSSLSKAEADKIIRNEKFPVSGPIAPAPAPSGEMNINE